MIRLIIILIFVALVLILFLPILGITWLLEKAGVKTTGFLQKLSCVCLFIVGKLTFCKTEFIGREKIPKDEAVLYVLNHQSYFDIIYTYPNCPGLTGYIAKKEMKKIPILPMMMARINCLFIDRANIRSGIETILESIKLIKSGVSIAICPEGTVNKTGRPNEVQEFKSGSFKIASKAGCMIQPVAIANTNYVFEHQKPLISSKKKVIIEYLDPVRISDLSEEDQKHPEIYFRNLIQETINKNLKNC